MFQHVPAFPGDPILSLNEDFQQDPRAGKVNLGIGIYFDDAGRLPVMAAVREAEEGLARDIGPRPYLPMEGAAAYRAAVQQLVFGSRSEAVRAGRIATLQTPGGSGALRVGSDFLKTYFGDSQVWISDPSWDNHRAIFEGSGFKVKAYPYYDAATGGVRFDEMLGAIGALPARSIVLLHACCHNPTGVDLTRAQWAELVAVLQERQLVPFLDMAYQGFGDGLEEDAFAIRAMAAAGLRFFVANSFSKNFSLYGERCGALSVVCADEAEAQRVLGQLKSAVRRNYSNPPTYGARVVAAVLNTPALRERWQEELQAMRARIHAMRGQLRAGLESRLPGRDFSCFTRQRGMFSYTGLAPQQVQRLRESHGVYLVGSGRMCVAGLSVRNVEVVADAMADVLA
jgi:aromatic-amino-acid transaminase